MFRRHSLVRERGEEVERKLTIGTVGKLISTLDANSYEEIKKKRGRKGDGELL